MNQNDLYRAIGEIDDKYILEAEKTLQTGDLGPQTADESFGQERYRTAEPAERRLGKSRLSSGKRWIIAAVCAVLAVGIGIPAALSTLRMGSSGGSSESAMNYSVSQKQADQFAEAEDFNTNGSAAPQEEANQAAVDSLKSEMTGAANAGAASEGTGGGLAAGSESTGPAAADNNSGKNANSESSDSAGLPGASTTASGDWPAAIMVGDTIYYSTGEYLADSEISEDSILGNTVSYTDEMPAQSGETNFLRETGVPYAKVQGGIAVKTANGWLYFTAKE